MQAGHLDARPGGIRIVAVPAAPCHLNAQVRLAGDRVTVGHGRRGVWGRGGREVHGLVTP